ncbi:MAG: tetratricopeptide repeat protein, partial [Candidatus Riflebacteria bacterium]
EMVKSEIKQMLESTDASTRRSAAFVLAKVDLPERGGLIHLLLQDSNFGVRKMALKAALELEGNVGIKEIMPLMADENQWVRKQAVECAIRIEDFSSTSVLEMFEREQSPAVIESILKFIVDRNLKSAVGMIFDRIRREPEEELPWLIAALGHLGAIEELGKVKKFLGPVRAEVFSEYFQALLLNGDLTVFSELGKALKDRKRENEMLTWTRVAGSVGSFATDTDRYSKTMYQALLDEVQKDMDGVAAMSMPVKSGKEDLAEAIRLHDAGEHAKAKNLLEPLAKSFADDDEIQFYLASSCYNLGEVAKAQSMLEKIQRPDGYLEAAILLGQIYFKKKEWRPLIDCYESVSAQIADNDRRNVIRVFGALGLAYFHEKVYDKAIVALNRGLQANPRDLSSSYHLALCYYAIGETEKAKKILESLRKTLPADSKVLKNVIELLQRI